LTGFWFAHREQTVASPGIATRPRGFRRRRLGLRGTAPIGKAQYCRVGSYASLSIDGYELFSTKSYVDAVAMTVFTEHDRIAVLIPRDAEPGDELTTMPRDWTDADLIELPDGLRYQIGYQTTGRVVADRLEAMGVTLAVVRSAFERRLREQADEIAERMSDDVTPRAGLAQLFRDATFLDWSSAFQELMTLPEHPSWPFFVHEDLRTEMMRYIAEAAEDGSFFGMPGDMRYLLRGVTEVCGPDATVEYDITDLVGGGWYQPNEPVAANAVESLRHEGRLNAPSIVLTEGSTDGAAIEGAMAVLAPHLVGYFTFLDFKRSNAAGGATALVAAVKSFVGAGVLNRVIALFDNDTAGRAAIRALERTQLPDSCRILVLPDVPIGRDYPTEGPSGHATQDVNGRAGSIELYFGVDVLTGEDGILAPVVWRGYDDALHDWQGELRDKRSLQTKFHEKLARAQAGLADQSLVDWTGMELVIERLMTAFVDAPISSPARN
jgi:HEPN/Toprim N-terminal domain 1